jgi:hypothetical protein
MYWYYFIHVQIKSMDILIEDDLIVPAVEDSREVSVTSTISK